jgi:hypothetical protein
LAIKTPAVKKKRVEARIAAPSPKEWIEESQFASLAFGRSLELIADANLKVQAMILFLICFSLIYVLSCGCFLPLRFF